MAPRDDAATEVGLCLRAPAWVRPCLPLPAPAIHAGASRGGARGARGVLPSLSAPRVTPHRPPISTGANVNEQWTAAPMALFPVRNKVSRPRSGRCPACPQHPQASPDSTPRATRKLVKKSRGERIPLPKSYLSPWRAAENEHGDAQACRLVPCVFPTPRRLPCLASALDLPSTCLAARKATGEM